MASLTLNQSTADILDSLTEEIVFSKVKFDLKEDLQLVCIQKLSISG